MISPHEITHDNMAEAVDEWYDLFVHEFADDEAWYAWACGTEPYTKRNRKLIAAMPWLSYINIYEDTLTHQQVRYLKEARLGNGDRLFVLRSAKPGIEYRAYKINGTGRSQTPEGVSCDQALAIQAALSWMIKVRA